MNNCKNCGTETINPKCCSTKCSLTVGRTCIKRHG